MKAFAAEREREPDATKSRTAGDIAAKICKSQDEFDRVMEFVGPRCMGLIQAWSVRTVWQSSQIKQDMIGLRSIRPRLR